jgi:hypothetical protein
MYDDIKNLPLFGGKIKQLSYEFDFSAALSMNESKYVFSADRKLLENFVESCHVEKKDPNFIISSLIKLYLEQKDNS